MHADHSAPIGYANGETIKEFLRGNVGDFSVVPGLGGWNDTPIFINAAAADNALMFPAALTPVLREVLGLLNFMTIPIAHSMRIAGHDIPRKCEEEQAYVLHWLIRIALLHGADWRRVAKAEMNAMIDAVKNSSGHGMPSAATEELWCVHFTGPDDYCAARSKADAERIAEENNACITEFYGDDTRGKMLRATAKPWPYSAEAHAASLKSIDE